MMGKKIPSEAWQAAAGVLSAYLPGVTADQIREGLSAVRDGKRDDERNGGGFEATLRRKDVCDLLHISYNTLHRWIREGKIEKIKIGRVSRLSAASVRALMQSGLQVVR